MRSRLPRDPARPAADDKSTISLEIRDRDTAPNRAKSKLRSIRHWAVATLTGLVLVVFAISMLPTLSFALKFDGLPWQTADQQPDELATTAVPPDDLLATEDFGGGSPGDLVGETVVSKPLPVAEVAVAPEQHRHFAPPMKLRNSLGMDFCLILPGKFTMGSSEPREILCKDYDTRYNDFRNEYPAHEVTISKAFYFGAYEVTQAEFESVMGVNPSWHSENGHHREKVEGIDTGRFPVENVSWHDAVEFCRRLSALPEERREGAIYRLPTEAEWEYAARGGLDGRCSFDEAFIHDHAWTAENSQERTHQVGELAPNPFGLFDMHGNVWEWCHDWYDAYPAEPQTDPAGPLVPTGKRRVIRGGSWMHSHRLGSCRNSSRSHDLVIAQRSNVGFRVVREVDELARHQWEASF